MLCENSAKPLSDAHTLRLNCTKPADLSIAGRWYCADHGQEVLGSISEAERCDILHPLVKLR